MNDHMLNLRRFFRNRFEHYMDMNDSTATTELDGSRLTLRDLCSLLADDPELFPRYYDRDMRRVCGYHYGAWLRGSRTYGDAAIAIDVEREKIAVLLNPLKIRQLEVKPSVYGFDDLIAVELVRDGASVTKTQRGSQMTGAAVGSLLLGPAGLIVGGLSGAKRQVSKIEKLSIKLYANDLITPVQELFFLDFPGTGADPQQIQPILRDLDQWYGRLRVIVERKKGKLA